MATTGPEDRPPAQSAQSVPPGPPAPPASLPPYALRFSVDYPDRKLDRLSSALRIFWVIPIAIVLAAIGGVTTSWDSPPRDGRPREAWAPACLRSLPC